MGLTIGRLTLFERERVRTAQRRLDAAQPDHTNAAHVERVVASMVHRKHLPRDTSCILEGPYERHDEQQCLHFVIVSTHYQPLTTN